MVALAVRSRRTSIVTRAIRIGARLGATSVRGGILGTRAPRAAESRPHQLSKTIEEIA